MEIDKSCARDVCPNGYDECEFPNCNVTKDGHCAKHDVEVERRIHLSKELREFKQVVTSELDAMSKVLISHSKRIAWFSGFLFLAGIVVLGSYAYTTLVASKADDLISKLSTNVNGLLVAMTKNNESDIRQSENISRVVNAVEKIGETQHLHDKLIIKNFKEKNK